MTGPPGTADAADEPTGRTPIERAHGLTATLRRRWLPAAAVFALTVATALAVATHARKEYHATAQILIQPTDSVSLAIDPGATPSAANAQRDVDTNARLITVQPVAEGVRRRLGLTTSAHNLANAVSVDGQSDSNLVSITATDASPRRAAAIATAFAREYQAYRQTAARTAIDAAVATGEQRLAALRQQNAAPRRISDLETRVRDLDTRRSVETGGVQIVDLAQIPHSAASPNLVTVGIVGGLAGLALAIAAAFALDRADRRLLAPDEVEAALRAPVLARVPAAGDSGPAGRHAFAALVARLDAVAAGQGVLALVPIDEHTDAATVASSLATELAGAERSVIVIYADLRRGRAWVHDPQRGGLSAILRGESDLDRELVEYDVALHDGSEQLGATDIARFQVLPAGAPNPSSAALLGRPSMADLVGEARTRAEAVIVATPPLTAAPDALPVTRSSDAIILLAALRRTTAPDAEAARRALHGGSEKVAGVVLQDPVGGRPGRRARSPAVPAFGRRRAPTLITQPGPPRTREAQQ